MADLTLEQLNASLSLALTRLSQIDGSGLSDPSVASVPSVRREIEGLKETIHQVILVLDGQLNDLKTEVAAYKQLVTDRLA